MKKTPVKLEYDREVDAAYLTLATGAVSSSREAAPGLILDLDARGRVLGVEILRFTRRFWARARSRPVAASGSVAAAGSR